MPASALVRRVFIGLLVANLAVVGVKLAVGLSSGSLAVLGGAVDSCVDALNNVLALIVVRVAAKEPDEDHPYGHGKFETLGALAIVGFLSITCFELVREGVNHLVSGSHRVDVSDFQLALLVLTLGVNVLITWYEHRRGTELGSELLVADARSEEHTSELQSPCNLVCRLLLEKKKKSTSDPIIYTFIRCKCYSPFSIRCVTLPRSTKPFSSRYLITTPYCPSVALRMSTQRLHY